mmetsp:Transcript_106489/g.308694  ORF Transcript_106489/g.308694 Transcript_106489/m.308694 type:complete len:135 (-) Transcript_106489:8-412(-)
MAIEEIERLSAEAGGERVLLVGHSAGGWLARAVVGLMGQERASELVRGVVSLGAPHQCPPEGVVDVTRGVVGDLETRFGASKMSRWGVPVITVAGDCLKGDPSSEFPWNRHVTEKCHFTDRYGLPRPLHARPLT